MSQAMLEARNLVGVIPPSITPVLRNKFDPEGSDRLDRHLIRGKANAIFIFGTAGESPTVPEEQFDEAVKHRISFIKKEDPNMKVLIGISAKNIPEMLRRAKVAEENGADALVLVPNFGDGDPQEKLDALIKETNLNIVLYNNPGICPDNKKENLSLDFVKASKVTGRVVGIKSTSDPEILGKYLELQEENVFHVLQGGANIDTLRMFNSKGQKVKGIVSFESIISPRLVRFVLEHLDDINALKKMSNLATLAINPPMVKILLTRMKIIESPEMYGNLK